ncbi:TlpA disulfide reductase family protein [Streptomyces sp. NBS 14/10]|uniref:TlpA family protein disulfide reductase n=1 Tax=Streptomyces sp. NBS 14/10 TaxID=1945643 RepID=UPI000B7D2D79|nr:TlpA disulfide reductase family protein [Streptomyces sp. NBS 14/10]KAK1177273.1 TlpA disulfide reductase family protein [Streptomyces sp. NBS 14/10]
MNTRHFTSGSAAVLAAALLLSACGMGTSSAGDSGGSGDSAGSGGDSSKPGGGNEVISSYAPGEREQLREISGKTLEGKPLDLADYKGHVVVVNLWGSNCGPCRAEAPNLVKVAKETEAEGVRFVGINTRDPSREAAIRFEEEYGVSYPSLYDQMGRLVLKLPRGSVNPQAIPSTIFLDGSGRLAARALVPLSERDLRGVLRPLIAEQKKA